MHFQKHRGGQTDQKEQIPGIWFMGAKHSDQASEESRAGLNNVAELLVVSHVAMNLHASLALHTLFPLPRLSSRIVCIS